MRALLLSPMLKSRACARTGKEKKEADERLEQSITEVCTTCSRHGSSVAVSDKQWVRWAGLRKLIMCPQVEVARKERSALEKVSGEATAKLKDLDAQRATLIKTHAKDRQTWETQLRAAQAAEKDARTVAAKAAARAEELQSKSKTAAVTG